RGRHVRGRVGSFRPGGRPVRRRGGAQYYPRRGRDQCHARPHHPRESGPGGGRRARAAHRALRHPVRRRRRVRREHRRGYARDPPAAVVTAALAPLLREPRITADRVSEALHGEPLALLERRAEGGAWLRVRAGDGYHAWTHAGYLAVGPNEWAEDWSTRATGRSLGAELKFEDRRLRLVVGARVALRRNGQVETADGCAWN